MVENEIYEELATALDRLPNAFPRTTSGVELRLLRRLFQPNEAWLARTSGTASLFRRQA